MFKCIIVDDQQISIEVVEEHLKKIPQLSLVKAFTNPVEGLNFLIENNVDLAFLDVQMPDLDGFEIIEAVTEKRKVDLPLFIMITGHSQYAPSGFDYGVVDFLLKPVSFKRFNTSIERFYEKQKAKNLPVVKPSIEKDYTFISSNRAKLKLNYNDIAYVESQRTAVEVVGVGKDNRKRISQTMQYFEDILCDNPNFLRVSQSYIISVKYIESVKIKGNEIILNLNGQQKTISIGGTYKESVIEKLNLHIDLHGD